ncbi:hypothetical protein EON63_06725 [archaeon]|nr:MAG: hypothetical protein EON63_06725 [archaeon]
MQTNTNINKFIPYTYEKLTNSHTHAFFLQPIRETRAADLPLVVDHFRYFAGVIRGEEGTISELDSNTVSICLHEPLGM